MDSVISIYHSYKLCVRTSISGDETVQQKSVNEHVTQLALYYTTHDPRDLAGQPAQLALPPSYRLEMKCHLSTENIHRSQII